MICELFYHLLEPRLSLYTVELEWKMPTCFFLQFVSDLDTMYSHANA